MGAAGRAKDRAAKASSGTPSDFKYDPSTNRATKKFAADGMVCRAVHMIDRDVYFDEVRNTLFSGALTQQQVDGQSVILAVWEYQAGGTPMTDIRWLAYMLATVYHECATRMWPTTEYGIARAISRARTTTPTTGAASSS